MDAFGMPTLGGTFTPRIKFGAKSGRAFRVDRCEDPDGTMRSVEVDITASFGFMMALESFTKGWWNTVTYKEVMVPISCPAPAMPSNDVDAKGKSVWVAQVKFLCKLSQACGGDVRSFSLSSQTLTDAVGPIYADCMKDERSRDHSVIPAIRMTGVVGKKSQYGTNYAPVLEVLKWIPRPTDFPYEPAQTIDNTGHDTPGPATGQWPGNGSAANGNGHQAAPVPAATTPPPAADDDPFADTAPAGVGQSAAGATGDDDLPF